MSAASRRKGIAGERDAADVFRQAGWTMRGLESSGDWLAMRPAVRAMGMIGGEEYEFRPAVTLHVECKRQERLRITEWLAQAAAEAPPGVPAVVVFRQNKRQWYATLPLSDLLDLIG